MYQDSLLKRQLHVSKQFVSRQFYIKRLVEIGMRSMATEVVSFENQIETENYKT